MRNRTLITIALAVPAVTGTVIAAGLVGGHLRSASEPPPGCDAVIAEVDALVTSGDEAAGRAAKAGIDHPDYWALQLDGSTGLHAGWTGLLQAPECFSDEDVDMAAQAQEQTAGRIEIAQGHLQP